MICALRSLLQPDDSNGPPLRMRSLLRWRWRQHTILAMSLCFLFLSQGCGTTKQNMATEQMLNSDAVDAAVAKIDFTPLAGQRVFFDTRYMVNYKGPGFVNADYVISSMRQQMAAAGLLLTFTLEESDYVLEGRVGVLGTDAHEVVYGIPSNSAIGSAASIAATATTGAPAPASIPELSLARKNDQSAASKIGVYAYDRVTREVVWQSGSSVARATAKDLWVFGIGPFQRGSIYNGKVHFAGETPDAPIPGAREGANGKIVAYNHEQTFRLPKAPRDPEILHASGVSNGEKTDAPPANSAENNAEKKEPDGSEPEKNGATPAAVKERPAPGLLAQPRNALEINGTQTAPNASPPTPPHPLAEPEIPNIPPSFPKPY